MRNWSLQNAKARFNELVKCAISNGPQNITEHGKSAVIVMSRQEYDKLTKSKISFVNFMRKSPLVGLELSFKRDKSLTKEIDL